MPRISIYSGEHQAMRLLIENYQLNYNALIKALFKCSWKIRDIDCERLDQVIFVKFNKKIGQYKRYTLFAKSGMEVVLIVLAELTYNINPSDHTAGYDNRLVIQ
ncbi:3954_t:CDS:2 [Rhizophagus irregularis]|nr:3954_t:CDS:2 [Rhizophagus irregularis]